MGGRIYHHVNVMEHHPTFPQLPCMVYLPTFTVTIGQMWVNIPYMNGMGLLARNKWSKQTFPTHLPGKHVHHRKLGAVQRSGRFSSVATRDVFQVQAVYSKGILSQKIWMC